MSSKDEKVCHKCGRRYPCGKCWGTGRLIRAIKKAKGWNDCVYCGGTGWGEPGLKFRPTNSTGNIGKMETVLGTDPAILCPTCEAEVLAAKAAKHIEDAVDGHGVRPFSPTTGRVQCKTPNDDNGPKYGPLLSMVKIPEPSDGSCSYECPFHEEGGGGVGCALGCADDHPTLAIVPGARCPGPGEYVLTRVGERE